MMFDFGLRFSTVLVRDKEKGKQVNIPSADLECTHRLRVDTFKIERVSCGGLLEKRS